MSHYSHENTHIDVGKFRWATVGKSQKTHTLRLCSVKKQSSDVYSLSVGVVFTKLVMPWFVSLLKVLGGASRTCCSEPWMDRGG